MIDIQELMEKWEKKAELDGARELSVEECREQGREEGRELGIQETILSYIRRHPLMSVVELAAEFNMNVEVIMNIKLMSQAEG